MISDALEAKWKKVLDEGRPLSVPDWVDKETVAKLLANQERMEREHRATKA